MSDSPTTPAMPAGASAQSHRPEDAAQAVPARFVWLKRLLWALAGFVVLIIAARLGWGWYAERTLASAIAEARARGEPVLPEDFAQPHVPDEDNAVFYFEKAVAALPTKSWNNKVAEYWMVLDDPVLLDEYPIYFWDQLKHYRPALSELRKARLAQTTAWPKILTHDDFGRTALRSARMMAKDAIVAAQIYSCHGELAEAIKLIRDIRQIANIAKKHGSWISLLVGSSSDTFAFSYFFAIFPCEAGEFSSKQYVKNRKDIELLITELLQDPALEDQWRFAQLSERAYLVDYTHDVVAGNVPVEFFYTPSPGEMRVNRLALSPLWQLNTVQSLLWVSEDIDFVNIHEILSRNPDWSHDQHLLDGSYAQVLFTFGQLGKTQPVKWLLLRGEAYKRMAAIFLAIRLYQIDHAWSYPASLAVLVPQYLPTIPIDPLDPAEAEIRYLPKASTPLLYSVGRDTVDDFALEPLPELKWQGAFDNDILFLERPPVTRPQYQFTTPTPVASTPQVPDDQREINYAEWDDEADDGGEEPDNGQDQGDEHHP